MNPKTDFGTIKIDGEKIAKYYIRGVLEDKF